MWVYHVAPIDFGWEHLPTVADVAGRLGAATAVASAMKPGSRESLEVSEFLHAWQIARDLASTAGWEGDFRDDPVVFWVPSDDGFRFGFVIKQDNNGSTFVVTPFQMPWLEN